MAANEVDALIAERLQYKNAQDWEKADKMRDEIEAKHSVVLEDNKSVDGWATTYKTIEELQEGKLQKSIDLKQSQAEARKKRKYPSAKQRMQRKNTAKRRAQKKRFAAFADWLIDTFKLPKGAKVLDVAGGMGGLCWELLNRPMEYKVTIVDPQKLRLSDHKRAVLLRKSDSSLESKDEKVQRAFRALGGNQLCELFNDKFCSRDAFAECDCLLGLHPDQATDYIVEAGLRHKKPFIVVPCCVFPSVFSHRKLRDGTPVRSREQLCQYLCEKNSEIVSVTVEEIPGELILFQFLSSLT